MEKKRIGVLEPDDDSDRQGLTNEQGFALVCALLKSKTLNEDERKALEVLKAKLAGASIADGVTDFFEDGATTQLVFKGLERYIAIQTEAKATPILHAPTDAE
jgi:hypothetical protein